MLMSESKDEVELFPILRGESVGEDGVVNGYVRITRTPENLRNKWVGNEICVLCLELEQHFVNSPGDFDILFTNCDAVLAEFGESIGEFAAVAYAREKIGIVKVVDASHVLEEGMHVRVRASENTGEIFFID